MQNRKRISATWFIVFCCGVPLSVAACAGSTADTDGPAYDESESVDVAVSESALLQCGIGGCAGGSHPASYSCNPSCGSCFNGPNQTDCQTNTASFFQCGLGCPGNWHATTYYKSSSCDTSFGDPSYVNAASCAQNSGSAFYKCGFGCPAGYHAQSTYQSSSCNTYAGQSEVNATYCVAN